MKIVLFMLLTWGLILGLPVILFVAMFNLFEFGLLISSINSVAFLITLIFFGEMWSRVVGRLLKFEK